MLVCAHMHERVSGGGAIVIVRNSRNFQQSPFGKTGGAVVCVLARYDTLGIAFANGENGKTAKMEICE